MSGDDEAEAEQPEEPVTDETPNAADPHSQKRQRQKKKLDDDNIGNFWRRAMSDPTGRLVFWKMLSELGTFHDTFGVTPAGFSCPEQTWEKLGERNVGQRLYKTLLKHDHAAVYKMHTEHDPEFMAPKPQRRTINDGE